MLPTHFRIARARALGKALLCMLALALTHCAGHTPAPVCQLDLNLQLFPPWQPKPQDIDLSIWSGLLLRGVDMDCTGRPLATSSQADANEFGPNQALHPAQLQLQEQADGAWLVWLKTHLSADGIAAGPVAEVRVGYEQMQVLAIGSLSASSDGTKLTLVRLEGYSVLRVDSGACASDANALDLCQMQTQLLAKHAGRFVTAPSSTFDIVRREQAPRPFGGTRLYALQATCGVSDTDGQAFEIKERLVVTDIEAGQAVSQGRIWRRSEGTRTLRWENDHWQASGSALWDRIRTR